MMNSQLRCVLALFLSLLLLPSAVYAINTEAVLSDIMEVESAGEMAASTNNMLYEDSGEAVSDAAVGAEKTIAFYSDYSSTEAPLYTVSCTVVSETVLSFTTPEPNEHVKEGWIFVEWVPVMGEKVYSAELVSDSVAVQSCEANRSYYISNVETDFVFEAKWKAECTSPVASVGNYEYASLNDALYAWTEGTSLKLLQDAPESNIVIYDRYGSNLNTANKILDLNGYSGYSLMAEFNLTVLDSSESQNGSLAYIQISESSGHKLIIAGGNYLNSTFYSKSPDTLKITGGVFNFDPKGNSTADCYIPVNYSTVENPTGCWKVLVPQTYTADIELYFDMSTALVTVNSDTEMKAGTPVYIETPYTVSLSKDGYSFGEVGKPYAGKVTMTGDYGVVSNTVTEQGLVVGFQSRYGGGISFSYTSGTSLDSSCVSGLPDGFLVDSVQKNDDATAIVVSISNGQPFAYSGSEEKTYTGTVQVNGETVSACLSEDELDLLVYIPIYYTVGTFSDVSTISGGGKYTAGTTVTLIAEGKAGYNFDGWYLYDSEGPSMTKVSSENSYSFKIRSDVEYYARYLPQDGDSILVTIPLPAEGGSVTVKQGDTTVSSISSPSSKIQNYPVTFGESYTVTYTAPTGYEFNYWANGNGKKLNESSSLTLDIYVNTTLQPCVKPSGTGTGYQILWMDVFSQKISETVITDNLSDAEIAAPTAPVRYGYDFTGWSLSNGGDAINAEEFNDTIKTQLSENFSVTLYACYTSSEASTTETYTVTIRYINSTDSNKVLKTVEYKLTASKSKLQKGAFYMLEVPSEYNSLNLAGIRYTAGTEYLCQSPSYSFMLTGNMSFDAVYQKENVTKNAIVIMSAVTAADKTIYLTASHDVPEECTVLEYGIIRCVNQAAIAQYNGNYTEFKLESNYAKKFAATDTATNGIYTLGVDQTGYLDDKLLARGYVIYTESGSTKTIYSEPVCTTYNSLVKGVG